MEYLVSFLYNYNVFTYKVEADYESMALEKVIVQLEKGNSGLLYDIDEIIELVKTDYDGECKEDEFSFAQERLNFIYVDGTEYGAKKPYFLKGEYITISRKEDGDG